MSSDWQYEIQDAAKISCWKEQCITLADTILMTENPIKFLFDRLKAVSYLHTRGNRHDNIVFIDFGA